VNGRWGLLGCRTLLVDPLLDSLLAPLHCLPKLRWYRLLQLPELAPQPVARSPKQQAGNSSDHYRQAHSPKRHLSPWARPNSDPKGLQRIRQLGTQSVEIEIDALKVTAGEPTQRSHKPLR